MVICGNKITVIRLAVGNSFYTLYY